LIQPDDVHAGQVGLGGKPLHILGFAAPFQAMQQDDGTGDGTMSLPMAKSEHLAVFRYPKEPGFDWHGPEQTLSRKETWKQRHRMSVAEEGMGCERRGFNAHTDSLD
jgi:hypothetical protein